MVVGLDTSVVVRLLVGEPVDQVRAASERLARLHDAGTTILVTDLAVAEAYYALHHHYGVPKREARDLLRRFVESGVVALDPVTSINAFPDSAGTCFVDRLIHERHRAHAGTTLTFERGQAKLVGAEHL